MNGVRCFAVDCIGHLRLRVWLVMMLWLLIWPQWVHAQGARQATITTQDGRQLSGTVVSEDDKNITLQIAGINTPIARSNIRSLEYLKSIAEQLKDRKEAVKADDVDGRYAIVSWLVENREYTLAASEIADLLKAFPEDARSKQLQQLIEARLKQQTTTTPPVTSTTPPATTPTPTPATSEGATESASDNRVLTPEQINLIKVYELPANVLAAKPRVTITRDVLDEFLERYKTSEDDAMPRSRQDQATFKNAPGYAQLNLIMQLRAREFYSRTLVRDDPPVMQQFRNVIHRQYVLNYCGTNTCHGGTGSDAPDPLFFRDNPNSEATIYTNFYILQSYENKDGFLVDRDEPARSLLLQYAMPRDQARTPHPDVKGWRPFIRNSDDRNYQVAQKWIDDLWSPRPSYGIGYQRPTGKRNVPATQPAN